jgi:hypothetical protein
MAMISTARLGVVERVPSLPAIQVGHPPDVTPHARLARSAHVAVRVDECLCMQREPPRLRDCLAQLADHGQVYAMKVAKAGGEQRVEAFGQQRIREHPMQVDAEDAAEPELGIGAEATNRPEVGGEMCSFAQPQYVRMEETVEPWAVRVFLRLAVAMVSHMRARPP